MKRKYIVQKSVLRHITFIFMDLVGEIKLGCHFCSFLKKKSPVWLKIHADRAANKLKTQFPLPDNRGRAKLCWRRKV